MGMLLQHDAMAVMDRYWMLISLMCCLDLSSKGVMMQQNISIPSKLFGILHYAHIPINLYHASLGMLCLGVCV